MAERDKFFHREQVVCPENWPFLYSQIPSPPATPPLPRIELPPVSLPPGIPLLPPVVAQPVPVAPMPKPVTPAPLPVVPPVSIPTVPVIPSLTAPPVPVIPPVVVAPPRPVLPPPEALTPTPLPLPAPVVEKPKGPGKYLVTADGKLVEGVVTKSDNGFVVRRGSLDQPYAAEKVLFVGYTKDDVYQFMLGRIEAGDAETRLKLARWCVFNGMRSQGLTEAKAVQKLQPTSTAAADMVRSLEESLKKFPEEGPPAAKPEAPAVPPIPPAVIEAEIDVTADGVMSFTTKAHPVLVNLCASCHAKPTYGGAFKLARSTTYDMTPATTRQNLRAVAAQLKKDDPSNSPLLLKALAAHGGMKEPACASRQAAAFRNLEAWVSVAVGADVLLMRPTVEPRPPVPTSGVVPITGFGAEAKPDPKPTAPSPTNTGSAIDEFDPSVFNRAVHPK